MNELNDFEPIPFSRRNRRQSLDDEKRLSRDIFDPEFMKAIFGSEQKVPYVSHKMNSFLFQFGLKPNSYLIFNIYNQSNENDEPRMSFHAHQPGPRIESAQKFSNSKVHSSDWNREGKQQKPHHRKRASGDFSDGNFSAGAFCEPFKDLSTKVNHALLVYLFSFDAFH